MTSTIDIRNLIASLSGIPMTLESGVNFPINSLSPMESTNYLMENSPFFIALSACGGIKLTTRANGAGNWLISTSTIIEAKSFDNGYCYFVTENGHKYQFTTFRHKVAFQQKKMPEPQIPVVKQYESFNDLPFNEKEYFEEHIARYIYTAQNGKERRYTFGVFTSKNDDFGFANGAFCHISNSRKRINSLIDHNGKNVVGYVVDTPRGCKLCDYVFEGIGNDDEYTKIISSLEAAAKCCYLKEVNESIKRKAEKEYESAINEYNKQMEIQSILGFHAVNMEDDYERRAYCDYKRIFIFEFSRPISRNEFSDFLYEMGMEEKFQNEWYSPYTIVTGKGDKWTYTYVSPSTH